MKYCMAPLSCFSLLYSLTAQVTENYKTLQNICGEKHHQLHYPAPVSHTIASFKSESSKGVNASKCW